MDKEKQSLLSINSNQNQDLTWKDKLKDPSFHKYLLALFCLSLMIIIWIGMAELLQGIEASSSTKYSKPYFMVWFVHVGYTLNLIPWTLYQIFGKNKKTQRDLVVLFIRASLIHIISISCGYTWYLSLPQTSVSGNTAIYNSSPIFVFIFSIFVLKEHPTLLKIGSVLFCSGGVVMVSLFGSGAHEEGANSTVFGYIAVVISTLLYAIFEVLYKKVSRVPTISISPWSEKNNIGPSTHTSPSIWDSFLFMGLMGLSNIFFFWPILLLLNWTKIEVFEFPEKPIFIGLLVTTVMDATFNLLLLFSISLTSPLFVSVACLLTIPVSVVADLFVHKFLLPVLALVGIGLIGIGFVGINLAEYLELKEQYKEELKEEESESKIDTQD